MTGDEMTLSDFVRLKAGVAVGDTVTWFHVGVTKEWLVTKVDELDTDDPLITLDAGYLTGTLRASEIHPAISDAPPGATWFRGWVL